MTLHRLLCSLMAFNAIALCCCMLPFYVDAVEQAKATKSWPFENVTHPLELPLTRLALADNHKGRPFPTGAFWTNFVLTDPLKQPTAPVVTMPYVFRLVQQELQVSYPIRVATDKVIQNGFLAQFVVNYRLVDDDQEMGKHPPVVTDYDELSATLRFAQNPRGSSWKGFEVYLVRGAPYVTMKFVDAVMLLHAGDGLRVKKLKQQDNLALQDGTAVPFAVYSALLSNNQQWEIYVSDESIQLVLQENGVISSSSAFSGVVRIAYAPSASAKSILLESSAVYPVGGNVTYEIRKTNETQVDVYFNWKVRHFEVSHRSTNEPAPKDPKLLMLALPHHVDILEKDGNDDEMKVSIVRDLIYTSIRGIMTGVLGNRWTLVEDLPNIPWEYSEEGLFGDKEEPPQSQINMRKQFTDAIINHLEKDAIFFPQFSPDVYNFGKQIAREARLLSIAERFDQADRASDILEKMKSALAQWLEGTNQNPLGYDQRFGGLVSLRGLQDPQEDFGNGFYNDHHFHYGYVIYALAIIRKHDPLFIQEHAQATAMLLGDIGTPLATENCTFTIGEESGVVPGDLFPPARHKDWYVGHSYASGLFRMEVGKSQESSSEAVNAYYALALFSSLDSSNEYSTYVRLLLATEIRSTQKYWQIQPNSKIYEPVFAENAMVGVVGEMSVVYSTWFGDKPVYIHGINMIPFTPISSQLLQEEYVADQFSRIEPDFDALPSTDIWKSVICLDHAILDAEAAWRDLQANVRALDSWNSMSNSIYWIGTRRSWYEQKNRKSLTKVNHHEEDKCFGYPECSVAGGNGTALDCCFSLPGCCPSTLQCCPPREKSFISPSACQGEPQCAALGLGCCDSFEGCCEPHPVTGVVLGCCKKRTLPSRSHTSTSAPTKCHNQPRCEAAGLDCCQTVDGCCHPDPMTGSTLDCCDPEGNDKSACNGEPACAAANLDCCATDKGCCHPDPLTGLKLDCCIQFHSTPSNNSSSAGSPKPQENDPTCHGEPQCLTAGEKGAPLDCCYNQEGCCPGLLCCTPDSSSKDTKSGSASRSVSSGAKKPIEYGTSMNYILAVGLGIFLCATVLYCLITCYRRRQYSPIERDMRSWYCAVLMVVVAIFFVFLVVRV